MENKKIAILMATFNGEKFLTAQLSSIKNQKYPHWHLYIQDDGSQDATGEILKAFQAEIGKEKVTLFRQDNQGSSHAFLSLLCDPQIQADYYAYADQDDIWDVDKLQRAIQWLFTQNNHQPMLYCANVRLMDEHGKDLHSLPPKYKAFCFQNALVQCAATGNTMMFNNALRNILLEVGNIELKAGHDAWTYLVVTACGGKVHYDAQPVLSYRQHAHNIAGFSPHRFQRIQKSFKRVLANDFKTVNDYHLLALHKIQNRITPAARNTLNYFSNARQGNFLHRIGYLHQSGVYRQDTLGTLGIYIAAAMNKI